MGLAIRTVLSTWEGQALAGELDVAPSVVHKDRAPATGRRAGRLSARRSASSGRCLGGMPDRIARGPRASSARSRRISSSAERGPPAAPGEFVSELVRYVGWCVNGRPRRFSSWTAGRPAWPSPEEGGRSRTRDNGETSNGYKNPGAPLYPNFVMRYCHFRYCRLG